MSDATPKARAGFPDATAIYIEESAHCDWDWVATFLDYLNLRGSFDGQKPVRQILDAALSLIQRHAGEEAPYIYAFCESGFLQKYFEGPPPAGFTVSGGGITSPDNLLSHGETFIRNYLIGRTWVIQHLGITPSDQMWIPDDFGHDAQLPVVIRALGLMGVAFERVAGASLKNAPSPSPSSPLTVLDEAGCDFHWRASDGSTVQARFLRSGYGQGNTDIEGGIQHMIDNADRSPSPILFSPMDNDFTPPYQSGDDDALTLVNAYNNQNPVRAILGTFDDFMKAVRDSGVPLATCEATPGDAAKTPFVPHPYWSGIYGTRPELKRLHYAASRTLLFAESMELFLEYLAFLDPGRWAAAAADARAAIAAGWNALVPSTHHDYITGTATQSVHDHDQMDEGQPYSLPTANRLAGDARSLVVANVVRAIAAEPAGGTNTAIFNALGFTREAEVVEIGGAPPGVVSSTVNGVDFDPVQYDGGDLYALATAPPLGYSRISLTAQPPTRAWNLSLHVQSDGSIVLRNDALAARITTGGIAELFDRQADPTRNLVRPGRVANELVWYLDDGTLYEFGFEMFSLDHPQFAPAQSQPIRHDPILTILENGPLVIRVAASFSIDDPNDVSKRIAFTQEYELRAADNLLRMRTTGAAPSGEAGSNAQGYSIMASFPFDTAAATLTFGTPHHWDTRQPRNFYEKWPPPGTRLVTFEPTHGFAIANDAGGAPIAAVYHVSSPGWGIVPDDGSVIGCVLRNTPNGHGRAAEGTDPLPHTVAYAIRVPGAGGGALRPPTAGAQPGGPLRESLAFNNPLIAALIPPDSSGELGSGMSLGSTTDPTALITAAKVGLFSNRQLVLRVYQPTNGRRVITVALDDRFARLYQTATGILGANAITALETTEDPAVSVTPARESVAIDTPYALCTISLAPS